MLLAACTASSGDGSPSFAPPVAAAREGSVVPVMGHPAPLSLLEDKDPRLARNKRLAFDMWRSIVNAGHVERADDLLTEGYIQHSPVLPSGRAAFKQIFSAVPRRDIPALVSPPLVTMVAEGDLVVMALREELREPVGSGRYTSTHFNLFRVEGDRLAEHWHSVEAPPGPDLPSPDKGGPQPVTGATGPAQQALLQSDDPALAANKRLVFDAWRHLIDAGDVATAARYLPDDFIEHDPRATDGTPAILAAAKGRTAVPLAQAMQATLVAMVAKGDLVVVVSGHEHPHPSRAGASYMTTQFNMFRIEKGRLAEHWTGAMKPGTVPGPYTD
ncbi:nuclear transport factor 2 family protein [Sphingobium sp. B2D3B]|uniref:nuclear transport factor 2 family protein n=1 Tax=Sphingobium sp. B2D3B TaxID=2940580 RepID=UPI00222461C1|nr:nuclear transport factor 2 family protein [Sphingobium sp. B2D3B]